MPDNRQPTTDNRQSAPVNCCRQTREGIEFSTERLSTEEFESLAQKARYLIEQHYLCRSHKFSIDIDQLVLDIVYQFCECLPNPGNRNMPNWPLLRKIVRQSVIDAVRKIQRLRRTSAPLSSTPHYSLKAPVVDSQQSLRRSEAAEILLKSFAGRTRQIIRFRMLGLSKSEIAISMDISLRTVNRVLERTLPIAEVLLEIRNQ